MSDELSFEIVMPFVVTTSHGGPYDDSAFVAGMNFQRAWDALANGPAEYALMAPPELVPQLDLAAMHYGYKLETVPWDVDPLLWVRATFKRP